MTDDKVKKRTVYCLSKKIPDENYDVYVGSTSRPLSKRLSEHIHRCQQKFYRESKLHVRTQQVGVKEWKITPLFEKTCEKGEIQKFEKRWIEVLDSNLNTNTPILDDNGKAIKTQEKSAKKAVDEKRFFCNVCEKAFQSNWNLNRHQNTLSHQFTFLNSLD